MTYLKQSIEINEKHRNPAVDVAQLEALLSIEIDDKNILSDDEEKNFLNLLQGFGSGKAITNLAEYLLMTQAMKGEIKVSVFS